MASIAYLVNQYPSPSHTFIRREIAALERLGIAVHLFSHRTASTGWLENADLVARARTQVLLHQGVKEIATSVLMASISHPRRFIHAARSALKMGWRARRITTNLGYIVLACILGRRVRACGATHIHAHFGTNPAAVALLCHTIFRIPYSFTAHGPHEFQRTHALSLDRKIASAAFVVAVSEYGLRELQNHFPAHAGKIHLIRCGLDSSWFAVAPTPIPTAPRLLSVARLDEQKNPLLLIRAAAELRDQGVAFHLTIVGDGPLRPLIEQEISERRLQDCVTLAGWQSQQQIILHLQQARASILSSRAEGLPVAIMESFAAGRPVIATDVGGVSELVKTGETGWLIPPGDSRALTMAMKEALCGSADHLATMASAGRARVVKCHDIQKSASALAALLRQA